MNDKKVFSGGKPIIMQINNSIERLQKIMNIIENSDKHPEIYLQEQLFTDYLESEFVINNTIMSYGEAAVNAFHIDFIQKVLKVLSSSIQFNEVTLESIVDENGYYSIIVNITLLEDVHPVLIIYPYFKKFEVLDSDKFDELLEEEKTLIERINKLEEERNFISQCYDNPALYCGDDMKLFIKMQNKAKKESILNGEMNDITERLNSLQQELYFIQDEIQNLNNVLTSVFITRDRYIERLKNRFAFREIKEEIILSENENLEDEEIEPSINLFNQSIEDNDENKSFFANMISDDEEEIDEDLEDINNDDLENQEIEIENIDENNINNNFNFFD